MSFNEQQMEDRLQNAPVPKAPASLRKQLLSQISLPLSEADLGRSVTTVGIAGWLRRWWPALAPAAISLACGVVMAVQRIEIRNLKQSIQSFSQNALSGVDSSATTANPHTDTKGPGADAQEQTEITRMKERASQLNAEITKLEQTRSENENLRKQLTTPTGLTAYEKVELDALAKARERAIQIACVNNMKQLGLGARMWAGNRDKHSLPPDILSMTNEMNTLKILICPADTNRPVAANWSVYTSANCSYEYLAASGTVNEPGRVMFRCPIHNNIGLCNGSVQSLTLQSYSESIVERDGKIYFRPKDPTSAPTSQPERY